jgi:hypothetical protein
VTGKQHHSISHGGKISKMAPPQTQTQTQTQTQSHHASHVVHNNSHSVGACSDNNNSSSNNNHNHAEGFAGGAINNDNSSTKTHNNTKGSLDTNPNPNSNSNVVVACLHAISNFIIGRHRAAAPDNDLIERICKLLCSPDEAVCMQAANILGTVIYQDYVDLTVNLRRGNNFPQSDNWGLSDPYVTVGINGQTWTSNVCRNTLEPVWEQKVMLTISDKSEDLVVG